MSGIFTAILGFFVSWFSKPKKAFATAPKIEPCADDKGQSLYVVIEDFWMHEVFVKKGTKTDGASIPLFLCSILGAHPFSPAIVAQSIAHDMLYDKAILVLQSASRDKNRVLKRAALEALREADNWFYDALRINNRRLRCKLFFLAVRAYSTLKFGLWEWYIAPIFKSK
ncbi:MAG: DUF1353 domain-containing protein [Campylobacteraceae bacterium]|jgi:hypothetical protein|nr:DUF1353 domain-containing protein [Campylobacteraceae bacterium]